MKVKFFIIISLLGLSVISACKKDSDQLKIDDDLIKKYLTDNNLVAEKTPNGLYYTIENPGTGATPQATSTVTAHYEGKLLNGTVFDSSYDRGTPSTFTLSQTILGWQEGVPKIKVGGTIYLYVPSHLGYGENALQSIPANSVLVFKVNLLKINAL